MSNEEQVEAYNAKLKGAIAAARGLELQEYMFAQTSANLAATAGGTPDYVRSTVAADLRSLLHLHRFAVIGWLLSQGATLPMELCDDRTHARPGSQSVDRPTPRPT